MPFFNKASYIGTATIELDFFLDFTPVELDVVEREPAELVVLMDLDPIELSVLTELGRLFGSLDAAESQLDWLETSLPFLFLDSLITGSEPHESTDVSRSDKEGEITFSTLSTDRRILRDGLDLLSEILDFGGLGAQIDEALELHLVVFTNGLFLPRSVLLNFVETVFLGLLLVVCNRECLGVVATNSTSAPLDASCLPSIILDAGLSPSMSMTFIINIFGSPSGMSSASSSFSARLA